MGRRRQLVLFLAVLILPAALIAVQGYRLSVQERELARSRAEELRKRTAADIGQDVVTRLDRIRTQEMANMPATPTRRNRPSDPAVVAVGWIEGDRLVWPWDVSPAASPSEGPEFLRAIDAGKRAEFIDLRADRAAELYRQAIAAAQHDAGRASARVALARTQLRAGGRSAAAGTYRAVLALPSSVVDDHGLSCWSSAAMPLVELGGHDAVLARVDVDLGSPALWPAVQMYRYRTILEALQSSRDDATQRRAGLLMAQLTARLTELERAESLQRDFARLPLSPTEWRLYKGKGLWLVGRSPEGATAKPLVLAVRWDPILQAVESERLSRGAGSRFQIAADAAGDTLSADLPDLHVTFPDGVADQTAGLSPQRSLWGLSFGVVALLTCLSGYLLWRDVRREAHIAELRTQFVSSVSHELKTPLTSIRMFAELLQMKGGADPQQARFLDTIVSESERLTRLLNNVLDFSRIERGQKTYRLEPAALPDVVQAAVRAIQYPLAQQGFALDLRLSDGIPPVAVDRDALQQAILNLLTNAMKYSGSQREIGLRLATENGTAMIQVSDRGIGIPEHEHARIFEKFYRVPIPENREISGTGLGLSLVAHIAEAHGGSVHVTSRPGEGSTFSILLPLKAGDAA
jgi:signal transduction histidine kinase